MSGIFERNYTFCVSLVCWWARIFRLNSRICTRTQVRRTGCASRKCFRQQSSCGWSLWKCYRYFVKSACCRVFPSWPIWRTWKRAFRFRLKTCLSTIFGVSCSSQIVKNAKPLGGWLWAFFFYYLLFWSIVCCRLLFQLVFFRLNKKQTLFVWS